MTVFEILKLLILLSRKIWGAKKFSNFQIVITSFHKCFFLIYFQKTHHQTRKWSYSGNIQKTVKMKLTLLIVCLVFFLAQFCDCKLDPYKVLGVKRSAKTQEIRSAYRWISSKRQSLFSDLGLTLAQISANGTKRAQMGPNGLKWVQMGQNGLKWTQMVSNGLKRSQLSNGTKWVQMDSKCLKWAQMSRNGLKWSGMGSNDQKWSQMGQNGLKWTQKVSNGLLRSQLSNGTKWIQMNSKCLKWAQMRPRNIKYKVRKFHRFSITYICCEINYRDFKGLESAIFTNLEALNFDWRIFALFIYLINHFTAPEIEN